MKEIEKLIYPVSFYRNKARFVKATCEKLVKDFGGKVPSTLDEMVTLPGVGRKTANLVMILASRKPAEHLRGHARAPDREPSRVGEDEIARGDRAGALPNTEPRWWPYINLYLVTWGQNVCRPVYPRCGDCAIASLCPKIGVTRVGHSRGVNGPINSL